MSGAAPRGKGVRKVGSTLTGKCNIEMPSVCIATENGQVQVFHVIEDKQQLHACHKCFEQLVLAGQWVQKS